MTNEESFEIKLVRLEEHFMQQQRDLDELQKRVTQLESNAAEIRRRGYFIMGATAVLFAMGSLITWLFDIGKHLGLTR